MAIEDRRAEAHSVKIENREKLFLTGVEDVGSFDEENMVIETCMGEVIINGSDLHIQKFNVDNGELVIEGNIDEFVYADAQGGKKGLFSRLFG